MQNYVSFCLIIAHVGEKNFEKRSLFMNLKILQNGGKAGVNTPSPNLGLAGLLYMSTSHNNADLGDEGIMI
jgi:hypothetical protein